MWNFFKSALIAFAKDPLPPAPLQVQILVLVLEQ